jgi:hypothetical protein
MTDAPQPKRMTDVVAISRITKILDQLTDASSNRVLTFVIAQREEQNLAAHEARIAALHAQAAPMLGFPAQ